MHQSGYWHWGAWVNKTKTTSPSLKSSFSLFHFLREFKLRTHSFNQPFQKCLINSYTRRHVFFKLNWVSSTESGANVSSIIKLSIQKMIWSDDWYRQQDVMIDMSMVYCWLNLRHKSSHKFFVIYVCIPQYVSDCFFCCFDHYFMSSTKMWCCWRIEWTLNCFICCVLLDLLLIQLIHQIFRFFLCFHKITSIVWKHYFRNTSSTCHSRKCAKKWINIHLEWHLQMYCLGIQTRE